jgi:diguanylate cyclase (GGDEF)-like protein
MTASDDLIDIDSSENDNQDKLYAECVRIVYKRRFQNLLSHFFASILPLYLGWENEVGLSNLFLLFLLWAYTFAGYYIGFSSRSSLSQDKKAIRLGSALYYQIVFLAILYNLIFMNLAFNGVENAMIYLFLITVLFCAGGVSSYQHMKWLGPIFVISVMVPQCIYYLTIAGVDAKLMAFLIFVFIFFMLNVGLQLHKDAIHTLSLNHELSKAKEKAEQLARTDMLTGLNNRRAFIETGKMILKNAQRYGHPLSMVMLDIDNFKMINDTYGHTSGDKVIKALANVINHGVRESDVSGRLGGEEFAIILQETNLTAAQELIDRLRKEVEQTPVHIDSQQINVTASFGIAQLDTELDSFDKLLDRADHAMYQAKKAGRNRVVIIEG